MPSRRRRKPHDDEEGPQRSRRHSGRGPARRTGKPRREGIPATSIEPDHLDKDAKRVVRRLQQAGFEAYFVGGCVRDLLIGRRPKDFDVATDARPAEVRRLFRNCRIIGRRFKLAHIFYGDNIIETATFRARPREQPGDDEELLIVDDNEYGSAESDAERRDFTVNALFLDPTTHEIHDFVKGMADLEDRVLRTIGDPEVRLAEDPVRILRAIKFSARLDLEIDDETWDAMCELAPDLEKAAPPRVLEEILRLCRSGASVAAFQMMRDVGALAVLVPQLEDHLGPEDDIPERAEPFWDLLAALDARVRANPRNQPSAGLLISLLFAHPFALALEDETNGDQLLDARSRASVAWEVLQPLSEATRLSRKDFARARRVLVAQQNFTKPPERFSEILFARSEEFEEAFELFSLQSQARGAGSDIVEAWVERRRRAVAADLDELETERRRTRKRKRRRRRRRPGKG
ncbi:MAG: polynucleotide adenylyltransferase PcnB [Planctomycetota bacterium]|nr:polynucleotide adenylyltransferase PcnB [Planctomycetota bacterium]MEC8513504.1 polynucleotide adenylyltransferase PcnB [Planctomycetota bacterium]MEE2939901.1 polynucleotide adenylyltransferase PcnB [Planctomycetota bacterium]